MSSGALHAERMHLAGMKALVNALDARDQETKGHSIRVSHYMLEIARQMGVVEGTQDWIDMQRGSLPNASAITPTVAATTLTTTPRQPACATPIARCTGS